MKQRRIVTDRIEVAVIIGDNLVFEPHGHDEFVISANVIGDEMLQLNGKPHVAPEGATTLYNPADIQSGEGTSQLVSVYLQPDYLQQEFGASQQVHFDRPVVFDKGLLKAMQGLISPVLNNDHGSLLEEMVIEAILPTFERQSSRSQTRDVAHLKAIPTCNDWRVRQIKELLLSDLGATPSLDQLANEIGIGKPQMLRMFSGATGLPPARWQRQVRLREGRRMLKLGVPIARVANELGFADQAHFTRFFCRAYGMPPGRFSRLHQRSRTKG